MNGFERIQAVLRGGAPDRLPFMPILHSALASYSGVPLGKYLTDADVMTAVTLEGCRRLHLDGVQLSLGVTAEAEAFGARVHQPANDLPQLQEILLPGLDPTPLCSRDARTGGRMLSYYRAVEQTARAIGKQTCILATLRGPLLMASQLHGLQEVLIDLVERPDEVGVLLDFTTQTALDLGCWLLASGAHGLVLGEAVCSPNFISPALYRQLIQPRHQRLIAGLHAAGWGAVGLHICGNILAIMDDIIRTGVDLLDVDHQVPVQQAVELAAGRCALRGNLDPSADLFLAAPREVGERMHALVAQAAGQRWILSTGCDIPPGTSAENLEAFAAAALD
ncbi:MAG: uroporphyrinogen decarboxylase family protein [Chloroflexi bacterium]|nr:uroporphyrinogen decarboxylase family protein [Chloroflexota bacterium]